MKAKDAAIRMLAKREHGEHELLTKLINRGFSPDESSDVVQNCRQQGLQSDLRFVDMIIAVRLRQGYGPVRMQQELRAKQISIDLIDQQINQDDILWDKQILHVWQKKFKQPSLDNQALIAKQQRFLAYRGFSAPMIAKLFKYQLPDISIVGDIDD